jgi:threonine dehydratase
MLDVEIFREARATLEPVLTQTKLLYSKYFSDKTGNNVYLKPENMQVTGSFKIRGAYFKISKLSAEQRSRGLITASAGNHAQGVAYAAEVHGVPAKIVMPAATPLMKVNNTKAYGAEVILEGKTYDDACAKAESLAKECGYTFIHPFNDPLVAAGQGTIAYEILQDLPDADIILVPVGGGGLIAGVAQLAKALKPNIQVVGVEPRGAASMKAALAQGNIVTLSEIDTIADGVAVKTGGDIIFPQIQKNVDDIITIDDAELIDAFLDVMERHKMIVENAGLLSVAALKHIGAQGKNVVSLLSGGNMDVITMSSLVAHGLINRGRVFTFSVLLPDQPGQLLNIAHILAEARGNVIKLEHNQFVSINRNSAVELLVTVETFGKEHIDAIMAALVRAGYAPQAINYKGGMM